MTTIYSPDGSGPTQVSPSGGPPTISVVFLSGSPIPTTPVPDGTQVNQYVVVLWATSEAVLTGPSSNKNASNAWPYDATTYQSSGQYCAQTPATYTMPSAGWNALRTAPALYWRVGCSSHADLSGLLVGPVHAMAIGVPSTPPDPPSNVVATAGDGEATVHWTPPAPTAHPVTAYHVHAFAGTTEVATADVTGAPPAEQAVITGLTNGTAYTFQVTATNADGTSPASPPSAPVVPAGPPDSPYGVSATAGDAQATVAWGVPADHGSPITAYDVTAHHAGVDGPHVRVAGPPYPAPSSVVVGGLANGTAYSFTVTATNARGTSAASPPSVPVTPSAGPRANAGAGARWLADSSNLGTLMQDLVLDGSGSTSSGGPLTYRWEVLSGPGLQVLPWIPTAPSDPRPVVLAAGTVIPDTCLGSYTFRLTVSDGARSASATVVHELMQTGVRVLRLDGTPLVGLCAELITVGGAKIGTAVSDPQGVIPIPAQPPLVTVTVFDWELVSPSDATRSFTPVVIQGTPPEVASRVPAPPGALIEVAARRAFHLVCPQCGQPFKTIESPAGAPNKCPYDDYVLANLETLVVTSEATFLTPISNPSPGTAPRNVTSRGSYVIPVVDGNVRVYWDESRFFSPVGGDYSLWGRHHGLGNTVDIIGRRTWRAAAPITARRSWRFHEAALGSSPAYASVAIPRGENRPLGEQVLLWMTIHHTGIAAGQVTIRELQTLFQDTRQLPTLREPTRVPTGTITRPVDVAGATPVVIGGLPGTLTAYADFPVHYYIDAKGRIFEGRPLGIQGEQVPGFNAGNIGIALEGNLDGSGSDYDIPTAEQLVSLDDLVAVLSARFHVDSVWGHRERSGQADPLHRPTIHCPGSELRRQMIALRSSYPGPPP